MKKDFLAEFLNNPNQARILRTLILNRGERFSQKAIVKRSGLADKAAQKELQALKALGVARAATMTTQDGKVKKTELLWGLNESFVHIRALVNFVRDISPVEYQEIVETLNKSGKLSAVVLSGSFMGDDSRPADILVAADILNVDRLESAVKTLEPMFGRELRFAAFSTPEFRYRLTIQDRLIRDTLDYPHVVLLDRSGML